jgi:glycosyltransferase involved in cell wall biosynthesis
VTGFLTNVGDIAAMATYSLELLNDEVKLEQFKENALQQAQRFHINHIVPQYESLYEKVLETSGHFQASGI